QSYRYRLSTPCHLAETGSVQLEAQPLLNICKRRRGVLSSIAFTILKQKTISRVSSAASSLLREEETMVVYICFRVQVIVVFVHLLLCRHRLGCRLDGKDLKNLHAREDSRLRQS
ncbi:hypothetical protein CTAM01_11820, partial [Colletotrichum tamarilloi]